MSTRAFAELVARQCGVMGVGQAAAAGVPPRTVQHWARAWRRLHPGIYLVAGHTLTSEGRVRAAMLWAGADAVLTGQAAAGWHGMTTLAADRADSAAERLLTRLLRQAGITGWRVGEPFGAYTLDVAFPELKVAIEVDGWAWHVDAERFRGDRRKGNTLVRAGWTLLRFTWHDLTTRPAECVAEILDALALAAA